MDKKYRVLSHTADTGLLVKGRNLKDLFLNAACALFDIMAKRQSFTKKARPLFIQASGIDKEDLFRNWLNQLLSISSARSAVLEHIKIISMDEFKLKASVAAVPADQYEFKTEIKAATYHQLKVSRKKQGWQARVILDV